MPVSPWRSPAWRHALWGAAAAVLACGSRTEPTQIALPAPLDAGGPAIECLVDEDCEPTDLCLPQRCIEQHCVEQPVECIDDDPCTRDDCDSSTGSCRFEPLTVDVDGDGYRRPLPGFSTNPAGLSANDEGTEGFWNGPALTGAMDRSLSEGETRRLPDLGIALKSIAAFWLLYILLITARALVAQFPNFWEMMGRRAIAALVGCAITFLVYLAMRLVAAKSLSVKATRRARR